MIHEVVVTTLSGSGTPHVAPMGVLMHGDEIIIMPFKPSKTLENIEATGLAVLNFCDDVRIFAACLTNRECWNLVPTHMISGLRIESALTHTEAKLVRIEPHDTRPKLFFRVVHSETHVGFKGFNRAQFSVVEAAILVSRLDMLPAEKIKMELEYLAIGLKKTGGPNELQAWAWLLERVQSELGSALNGDHK